MSCKKKQLIKKIKVKCKPQLHPYDQWFPVGTGNYYKGKWNHRTMSGDGIYVMQNDLINVSTDRLDYSAIYCVSNLKEISPNRILGTVYEGNFDDGLFHGDGSMYYPSGSRIEGVWEKGKCVQQNYIFSDGLRFQKNNWQYCKVPDRRFAVEHVNGFEPAARSKVTNRQSTIVVPNGAYDAGDGFYWLHTNTVHDYWTNELIRVPTAECSNWIIENCHQGGKRVVGFQTEFYKNWYDTTEKNEGESTATDSISSEQFNNDNRSIMAEIKSIPWFDLSLRSIIQSVQGSFPLDQFSSSSTESFQLSRCQRTLGLIDKVATNYN